MDDGATGGFSGSRGPRPDLTYLQRPVAHRLSVPRALLEEHYPNNAALRAGLAGGGVTQKLLDALREVLDPALAADGVQAAAQKAAKQASEVLKGLMPAAEAAYDEVFRRAAAAGRTNATLRAALDVGARETNRTKRVAQMRQFLDAADGERVALDGYGTTDAMFAEARTALGVAEKASDVYARLKKEAEDATRLRDDLMEPLDEAMRDVQERGRAGMPGQPDLLELLGLPPG